MSSVPEANLSQLVSLHEPTLVYISVDAFQFPLTCILPHLEVPAVCQHGDALGILGYHDLVVVYLSREIVVIEIGPSIDEWFLSVGFLYQVQEFE